MLSKSIIIYVITAIRPSEILEQPSTKLNPRKYLNC